MIFKKIGNMEDVEVICHYLDLHAKRRSPNETGLCGREPLLTRYA
jgi:hypothetical protein